MNLSIDKNKGIENIEVDNLPAGIYNIYQQAAGASGWQVGGTYGIASTTFAASFNVNVTQIKGLANTSILLEVTDVQSATGQVTFRAQVSILSSGGGVYSYTDDNLIIIHEGVSKGYDKLGFEFTNARAMRMINSAAAGNCDVGDKIVLNLFPGRSGIAAGNATDIAVSATVNPDWPNAWYAKYDENG